MAKVTEPVMSEGARLRGEVTLVILYSLSAVCTIISAVFSWMDVLYTSLRAEGWYTWPDSNRVSPEMWVSLSSTAITFRQSGDSFGSGLLLRDQPPLKSVRSVISMFASFSVILTCLVARLAGLVA